MCCLKYEYEVYEEKNTRMPKFGAIVNTPDGTGEVCGVETLSERVRVKFGHGEETVYKKYNNSDIEIIKNGTDKEEEIEDELQDKEGLKELERLENLSNFENNEY